MPFNAKKKKKKKKKKNVISKSVAKQRKKCENVFLTHLILGIGKLRLNHNVGGQGNIDTM